MSALRSIFQLLGLRRSEPKGAWATRGSFTPSCAPRRPKTSWEVGRDYERYIGHLYEVDGWSVTFHGAIAGLDDRGRDLVAQRGGATHIIQCKRWARGKEIHEDVVFRFFASVVQYAVDQGVIERGVDILQALHSARIKGVIATTAQLSPSARNACAVLGVQIRELVPLPRYPQIKCNVGATGERIYHFPRDRFYDRIRIEPHKGELYAWTVAEAEAKGFRRARRRSGLTSVPETGGDLPNPAP